MAEESAVASAFKSRNAKELKVGTVINVPFRVVKLAGSHAPLVHLESVEAYGHTNPNANDKLGGRTKTALWVEPDQIDVPE